MTIELGCAGLWLAFTTAMVDGQRTDAVYKLEHRLDGTWTTTATFPRIDAEAEPVGAYPTLRDAIRAVDGFRRDPYWFA